MVEGIVFDVKSYAIHDGPGIRTTVFLKGCPLDCCWCHNPESKNNAIEKNVSGGHLETKWIGEKHSVESLFNKIIKDEIFYDESGGGVTFSGGEAMLQLDFLIAILTKCKQYGIHTTIDTSGYCPQNSFKKVLTLTNLFLFDIKLMDSDLHKKYIGRSNELILSNLRYLLSNSANIQIRIPLIPGLTDTHENLNLICKYLKPWRNNIDIELIPYNKSGESKLKKYLCLDKIGKLQIQSKETISEMKRIFNI